MPHPLVGKPAPSISLPDANGETFTLTPGANGVPVALFFYPKSGSWGCTKEACQFRDNIAEKDVYKSSGLSVIGISPDSVEKQKVFVEKQKLTYPVLSDTSGEARKAYHVGKGLLGLADSARVTFFIDSKGVVRDSLDSTLNYGSHSKFVTKWLDKINTEEKRAAEPAPASETSADAPTTDAPTTDTVPAAEERE
ncbi:peroxiredoxin Q [Sparassis latifolia]|uniref:thioredoxin-dependent peroxiredoxin n=1 Tax=Sparassis crispa TaxID=139825 RepID=A0A401GRX0_9APHY|nr:Peroxiredoxin DOT5 [Sparassis crispa]GBE84900.1 Peroxiredoxin DOT5 [Sparassis crispa]